MLSSHGRRKHNGPLLMDVFKWSAGASSSALNDCHYKVNIGYFQISYSLPVRFTPVWCCLSTHITEKTFATSYYTWSSFVHVQSFIPVYPECFLSFHCCTLFQCAPRVNKFPCYFNNSELKIFIYICASYTAYKNNLCPWFMAPPGQVIALRLGPSPLDTMEQDMFA